MLEVTHILTGVSVISLILAIAVAVSPRGRFQLRGLDRTAAVDDHYLRTASYLLMTAVGLSGAAAVLVVASWFD